MSEDSFIREVEEELRNERLQNFWKKYGAIVIAVAVGVVLLTGGYRAYEWYTAKQAADAGDRFLNAIDLADQGKKDEALTALKEFQGETTGAYKTLARLRLAAELGEKGDVAEAVETYDAIAADGTADMNFRSIARIRSGLLLVDTGSVTEVEARVGSLTGPGGAYRSMALEALGLSYFKAGDLEKAASQFQDIVKDEQATDAIKRRSNIMLALIAARGGPGVVDSTSDSQG